MSNGRGKHKAISKRRTHKVSAGERVSSRPVALSEVEKALISRTYFGNIHKARSKRCGTVQVRRDRGEENA